MPVNLTVGADNLTFELIDLTAAHSATGAESIATTLPLSAENSALISAPERDALLGELHFGAAVRQALLVGQQPAHAEPPQLAFRDGLPDTDGLTEEQKYDRYAAYAQGRGLDVANLPMNHRAIIGFRRETPTDADSTTTQAGTGVFDDRIVVIWKTQGPNNTEVKHVREFQANTEPSAQYDQNLRGQQRPGRLPVARRPVAQGEDLDGNGSLDLGRLGDGLYTYERGHPRGPSTPPLTGNHILRPTASIVVERDVNHDGRFTGDDMDIAFQSIQPRVERKMRERGLSELEALREAHQELRAALDAGDSILFHAGSRIERDPRTGQITRQNTFSAGCQTFPTSDGSQDNNGRGNNVAQQFWDSLGIERETGQSTFQYLLVTTRRYQ
jgi:hypothetical protein